MNRRTLSAVMLLGAVAGCGGYPPPTERMTTAEAAIRGATEVGATEVPRAQLHLKLAQEQTDKAKKLVQDGYHHRAELALRRAQADAELAIAIAKEHATLEKTRAAQAKVEQLRKKVADSDAAGR